MEKVLQEPFWAHFLGTQTIQIVPKYIGSGITGLRFQCKHFPVINK